MAIFVVLILGLLTVMQPEQPERRALSVADAAKAIGIGRTLMWSLVREGVIPSARINRRVVVRVDDIDTYLARLVKQ